MAFKEDKLQRIVQERGKYYGDFDVSAAAAGRLMTALIEQHYEIRLPYPIPAHLYGLLMAVMKLNRSATNRKFKQDNYDDAVNYLNLACGSHKKFLRNKRK